MTAKWWVWAGIVGVILGACASPNTLPVAEPVRAGTASVPSKIQSKEQDDCVGNAPVTTSVTVCNLQSPGAFRVFNRTNAPMSLRALVHVEVQGEGANWRLTREKVHLVSPRASVSSGTACVTLQPGQQLTPPPWDGFDCTNPFGPNCNGRHAAASRVRFVVLSCDEHQRFEGPPFPSVEYAIQAM